MMDFRKKQEAYLKTLQQNSPELYIFEKRLMDINNQTQQIMTDFQQNKITRERMRALVMPLVKEEMEIRNNPDYLVEQRLNMFLNMSKEQSAR